MEVKNYKGHAAVLSISPVTAEDIDKVIEDLRKSNPAKRSVQRAAQNGDTVLLDFAGFADGEQFPGGTAEGYSLVLGSGSFIPGFEDQLVGMLPGESRDVHVTFPENYEKSLSGKAAVFKCTIHQIEESFERALDEGFAKEVFGAESMDEARKLVEAKLSRDAEAEGRNEAMETILDAICKENPWTADSAAVDAELGTLIDAIIMQMTGGQPMDKEQFYKLSGMSAEDFSKGLRPTAERNLQVKEILKAVAAAEGLEPTDEEREKQLAMMSQQYGIPAEQLRTMVGNDMLDPDIMMQKTLNFLYENSDITRA